jgi:hypothetical protein
MPLNSAEVDAAWAEIVAGYDLTADVVRPTLPPLDPTAPPPASSQPDPTRDAADPPAPPAPAPERPAESRPSWIRLPPPGATPRNADPEEPSLLDGLDTFGGGLGDDDEGYTPPQAPPIPRPSMATVLAVLGIVGGLFVFLQPELLPMSERSAMLLGFAAVVSGFATLVWRLRPGDDDDESDHDDGARV